MKKLGGKKIAALASAMAIATVGGVYAAWVFSSSDAKYGVANGELSVGITTSSEIGSLGSYTVDKENTAYTVDQYSQAINNVGTGYTYANVSTSAASPTAHNAALCVNNNAIFNITFTATEAADQDVYNYGVKTTLTLTWGTLGYYKYDSTSDSYSFESVEVANSGTATSGYSAIFTMTTTSIVIDPTNVTSTNRKWTSGGSGVFTYEFTSDDLASLFTIADIVIEDTTTYKSFASVVSATEVAIAIAATSN